MIKSKPQAECPGAEPLPGSAVPTVARVDESATAAEVILRIVDPHSGEEVNVLYCTHVGLYYIEPYHRGRECTGIILANDRELLERLIRPDEVSNWVLASALGARAYFAGKIEIAPDFNAREATIRIRTV